MVSEMVVRVLWQSMQRLVISGVILIMEERDWIDTVIVGEAYDK
jgi:hypothetical protein